MKPHHLTIIDHWLVVHWPSDLWLCTWPTSMAGLWSGRFQPLFWRYETQASRAVCCKRNYPQLNCLVYFMINCQKLVIFVDTLWWRIGGYYSRQIQLFTGIIFRCSKPSQGSPDQRSDREKSWTKLLKFIPKKTLLRICWLFMPKTRRWRSQHA